MPVTLWAARYARAEGVVNRVSEIVLSLPGTVIILAFIAAVGTNMPLVMVAFGVLLFGALYRVFFGQAKSLHKQLYVEAAAVDGVQPMTASLRHVLPNMSTTVIVQFVLLLRRGDRAAGGPRVHRPRPAAARAHVGWHDPDRVAASSSSSRG